MKMQVFVCDRCDARLERDKDLATVTVKRGDGRRKNGEPIDLCDPCADALEEWVGSLTRRAEAALA